MQKPPGESVLRNARTVTTYLLEEPVKEAVREAIHEEATAVERRESSDADADARSTETTAMETGDASGSRSKRSVGVVLLAIGGLTYLLRRRMRSNSGGRTGSGLGRTDRTTTDRSTATDPETHSSATPEN